jgi:DNA-binding Lrp family transcriptional regulator
MEAGLQLDEVDRSILRELQGNLPVVKTPFAALAARVKITEDELFRRIERLIDSGIIRKFGLRIDSRKVGFASTLVAMKVSPEKLDEVADMLNSIESVTHNYARDHEYNLWFTVIERDEESLKDTLKEISEMVEFEEMLNLPVLRKFKINVRFPVR